MLHPLRSAFIAASPCLSSVHPLGLARTSFAPRSSTAPTAPTAPIRRARVHMQLNRRNNSQLPPAQDRILSILPYLIPLLDSLSFGSYVFAKIPLLAALVLRPLIPLYQVYRGIPLLAFGVFLALYALVVRNTSISRYIRFNVYQALIIDIALILPQLFQGVRLGIPSSVAEVCSTAVFYAAALAVSYAVVCNAQGKTPDDIPGISDSVYQQLGPF